MKPAIAASRTLRAHLILALASGLYSGYGPWMPGTWGSLVGLALAYTMSTLPITLAGGVWLLGLPGAVWICGEAARMGDAADPSWVVLDEIWGQWLVILIGTACFGTLTPGLWVWAFISFRFFDMVKPGPVRWAETRWQGGWGIVMDDTVAALLSGIVVSGLVFLGYIQA